MSSGTDWVGCVGTGKKPLMRLRMPVCVGAGRFNIDFPGMGIVTAEEEGEQDEEVTMTVLNDSVVVRIRRNYKRLL